MFEAVASSLTEMFATAIHEDRIAGLLEHYAFADDNALSYLRQRLNEAPREFGLSYILDNADTVGRSEIDGRTLVHLARGVRLREDTVRNQTVLLAPERAIALDEIAVAIIKEIDGHRSLDRIAGDLARRFEAPKEQVLQDIIAFIREFLNRRTLEIFG